MMVLHIIICSPTFFLCLKWYFLYFFPNSFLEATRLMSTSANLSLISPKYKYIFIIVNNKRVKQCNNRWNGHFADSNIKKGRSIAESFHFPHFPHWIGMIPKTQDNMREFNYCEKRDLFENVQNVYLFYTFWSFKTPRRQFPFTFKPGFPELMHFYLTQERLKRL